jgi:hypothetical protein
MDDYNNTYYMVFFSKNNWLFTIELAVLKVIVVFLTMLIGAEGARSSKMLSHFLRAVLIQRC